MSRTQLKNILTLIAVSLFAIAFFFTKPEHAPSTPSPSTEATSLKTSTTTPNCDDCYRVVKVVDGDTLDVDIEGVTSRVRVIGIDTPEVAASGVEECFGKEASARAHELLFEQFVRLEYDPVAGDKDKYGRMLRHVLLPHENNRSLTVILIDEGFAETYAYKNQKYLHRSEHETAQKSARDAQRGLWGSCKK